MSTVTSFRIRAPEVAGHFYPNGHNACIEHLEQCLSGARPSAGIDPKVLVAPHAGWAFSGPIAGTAYAALRARAGRITRVILRGPAARVAFGGIATTRAVLFASKYTSRSSAAPP